MVSEASTAQKKKQIAIYSDDSSVRAAVILALGNRIAEDLPEHEIHEFATGAALRQYIDRKSQDGTFKIDLFILDGEATPEGGLGVARQLKDEVFNCPPVLLITARTSDNWLATWSRAEATVMHPIDPFTIAAKCAGLLKSNSALAK